MLLHVPRDVLYHVASIYLPCVDILSLSMSHRDLRWLRWDGPVDVYRIPLSLSPLGSHKTPLGYRYFPKRMHASITDCLLDDTPAFFSTWYHMRAAERQNVRRACWCAWIYETMWRMEEDSDEDTDLCIVDILLRDCTHQYQMSCIAYHGGVALKTACYLGKARLVRKLLRLCHSEPFVDWYSLWQTSGSASTRAEILPYLPGTWTGSLHGDDRHGAVGGGYAARALAMRI